jgi:hypothetical protein
MHPIPPMSLRNVQRSVSLSEQIVNRDEGTLASGMK